MINGCDYQAVVLQSMDEERKQPTYNRKLRKCLEKTTSQTVKEINRNTHTEMSAIKLREQLRKKLEERKKIDEERRKIDEEIEELHEKREEQMRDERQRQRKKEAGLREIQEFFSR